MFTGEKIAKFKRKTRKPFGVPFEIRRRGVGHHFPERGTSYKRCRFCSTKEHAKRSNIICSMCNVALCCVPCFKHFHLADEE